MNLNKQEKKDKSKKLLTHERRSFLKKTAYATPTLVALGSLMKPTKATAADFGGPPSDPGTTQW